MMVFKHDFNSFLGSKHYDALITVGRFHIGIHGMDWISTDTYIGFNWSGPQNFWNTYSDVIPKYLNTVYDEMAFDNH